MKKILSLLLALTLCLSLVSVAALASGEAETDETAVEEVVETEEPVEAEETAEAEEAVETEELSEVEQLSDEETVSVEASNADTTASGYCGNNLTWTLDSDGVLTISGMGEMGDCPWYNYRSSITKVVIESGVTTIGNSAFSNCTSLTSVEIPDSVTSIGCLVFSDCTSLTTVTGGSGVTDIYTSQSHMEPFCSECPWAESQGDFVTLNGILLNYRGNGGDVVIPEGITQIDDILFYDVTSLTYPASLTTLGGSYYDFICCEDLMTIKFLGDAPATKSVLGMFEHLTATIYYPLDNETWTEEARACYSGDNITWAGYASGECGDSANWDLAGGVLTISGTGNMWDMDESQPWLDYRFNITEIIIEDGVTNIGNYAFYGLSNLTSVTIADSVASIGTGAFMDSGLSAVTIPGHVATIGNYAFDLCANLESITIPASVTIIGNNAFSGCSSLTTVVFEGQTPTIADDAFGSIVKDEDIGVTATAYYYDNCGWDETNMLDYGGTLTWESLGSKAAAVALGDVTGDDVINVNDVMLLFQYANKQTSTLAYAAAADVTGDGVVNVNDVMRLFQYANKQIPSL